MSCLWFRVRFECFSVRRVREGGRQVAFVSSYFDFPLLRPPIFNKNALIIDSKPHIIHGIYSSIYNVATWPEAASLVLGTMNNIKIDYESRSKRETFKRPQSLPRKLKKDSLCDKLSGIRSQRKKSDLLVTCIFEKLTLVEPNHGGRHRVEFQHSSGFATSRSLLAYLQEYMLLIIC